MKLSDKLGRLKNGLRHSLGNPAFDLMLIAVIAQTGHTLEHFVQVYQHLILGMEVSESHGILGRADIEPVHFWWNFSVMLTLIVVYYAWEFNRPESTLRQFKDMRWTFFTVLAVQGYHMFEHTVKYYQHIQTGKQGTPGIIGHFLGSDLIFFHFWINMIVYPGMVILLVLYIWHMQLYPAYIISRTKKQMKNYIKFAMADGSMSDDERILLTRIRTESMIQAKEILERMQAGANSDELRNRLEEMEASLIESLTVQALVDGEITHEEKRLIEEYKQSNPMSDTIDLLAKLHDTDHVKDVKTSEE
ncbi:MAG: hypothetical protein ACPHDO_02750 [Candidatus Poseidoniaceae archaeon]